MGATDIVHTDAAVATPTKRSLASNWTQNTIGSQPQYGRRRLSSTNFSLNIENSSKNSSKLSSLSEAARQDTRVVNEAFQVDIKEKIYFRIDIINF